MTTQAEWGHIPERTIGRRLRDAREDTGLSQSDFADQTGISRRTVSRYEQATSADGMKRPVLLAWAMATGVPLSWLQTGIVPQPGGGSDQIYRRNGHADGVVTNVRFLPRTAAAAA